MRLNNNHYIAFGLLFTAAATGTAAIPTSLWWFGWLIAFLYVVGLGWLVGRTWLADEKTVPRIALGGATVVCALVAQGAFIYRLADLGPGWTAALTAVVGLEATVASVWRRRHRSGGMTKLGDILARRLLPKKPAPWPKRAAGSFLVLASAALVGAYFLRLDAWTTDLSIRTPWDLLPDRFLAVVFLAAAMFAAAAVSETVGAAVLLPFLLLGLLFAGLAARLYLVGFGFDPFIHVATEAAILKDGAVLPKPPYYLGHYAAVIWLARVTGGAVASLNLWLVPTSFAAALAAAWWGVRRAFSWTAGRAALAATVILLLPLAGFTTSTPQGLADALLLAAAFLALPALTRKLPVWLLWLVALAAASVHPVSGVPIILLAAGVTVATIVKEEKRRTWIITLAVAGTLALPALFLANAWLSGGSGLDLAAFSDLAGWWGRLFPAAPPARLFDGTLDFAYAWRAVRAPALLALAGVGVFSLRRAKIAAWPFLIVAGAALADYLILKSFFNFDFLIAYERENYSDRLWPIALVALAPLMAAGLGTIAARLRRTGLLASGVAVIVMAAVLTSSLYLAYPRRDRHESSRGWSTSAADVEAVRLIEADADGEPYAVLASQATSAAALREFGFVGRYLRPPDAALGGEIYFYPIPTGTSFYAQFLKMNGALGSRSVAEETARMLGVTRLYYVIPFFWTDAGRIVPTARREADANWNVAGRDFVFRYDGR
jgi:hypothetical protein